MGSRLKQMRIAADLEIKEAAHRVNKTYQYVRQIEEGINDPPTWKLLREFARAYGTSVDYLLGLTDNPRPASNDKLPEGATEVIEYLAGMSNRGRAQLLKVAQILYEDDQDWKQKSAALRFLASVSGETALANISGDNFPAMLAEFGTVDALARYLADSVAENVTSSEGN